MHGLSLQHQRAAAFLFAFLGSLVAVPDGSVAATSGNGAPFDSTTTPLAAEGVAVDENGVVDQQGARSGGKINEVSSDSVAAPESGNGAVVAVPNSPIPEEEAIDYVQNAWNLTDLSDEVIRETLPVEYSGIAYKDWISLFLCAPDFLEPLGDGNYSTAAKEATKCFVEDLIDKTLDSVGLSGVVATASLASWPILEGINGFYEAVSDNAFESQMQLYFDARSDGNSYEEIANANAEPLPQSAIWKREDGWLYKQSLYANPAVPSFTPDQFYEYAERLWDAKEAYEGTYQEDKEEVKGLFQNAADGEGGDDDPPPDPEQIAAVINIEGDGYPSAPSDVSFSAAKSYSQEEIDSYAWDFGDGATANGETAAHTFFQPGTYDVTLTATDTEGNTDETTVQIEVSAPSFLVTPETLKKSLFQALADPEDVSGYSWDFGDGGSASGRTVSHTYDEYGYYEVSLTLSMPGGGTAVVTQTTYVGPRPIRVSGSVASDRVWPNAYGPYVINDRLTVDTSATLTVEPGAVVKFPRETTDDGAEMEMRVKGSLQAEGTAQDSVVFTSLRDDAYGGDTDGGADSTTAAVGDWNQIRFSSGSSGTFDHAVIRYGGTDQYYESSFPSPGYRTRSAPMVDAQGASLEITNSTVGYGLASGMEITSADTSRVAPLVEDSRFVGSEEEGLRIKNAGGSVQDNVFSENDKAIRIHRDGSPPASTLHGNIVQDNSVGVHLSGSPTPHMGTASEYGENVFRRNESYALKNTSSDTVQAVGNYWNATDPSAIDDRIVDNEESGSGPVIFEPFLEEPPTESIEIASEETGEISLGESGASVEITENSDPDGGELQYRRQDTRPLNNSFDGSATAPDGSTVSPDKASQRFWRINAESLSDVTFSVSLDATGTGGVGLPGQQLILKRSESDSTWTPLNTTREGDTLTVSGLTSFSQFAIGGDPASAPPSEVPVLASPSPGATGVPTVPSLSWDSVGQARQYRIQLSPEADFPDATTQSYTTPKTEYAKSPLQRETTYHWRVRAENSKGESGWSEPRQFTTRVPSVTFDVSQSFGGADQAGDYRLVALPGQVERPLGDAVSGSSGSEWQAFWDDGSSENYLAEYDGSDTFAFRPGRGFWLTSRQEWSLSDSVKAVPLGNDQATAIPLHEGWNIISNPLREGTPWSAVQKAHSDSLQPAWAFTGSFQQADTLRSAATGQAYYFLNDQGLDSLKIPYPTSAKSTGKRTLATESKTENIPDGHKGVMMLVAQKSEALRSEIQVGISPEAAAGLGPRDVVAPPAQFSALSLRLKPNGDTPARKGLLAAEWRPPTRESSGDEEGHTFSFQLQAKTSGPVEIEAKGLGSFDGRHVVLLRPSTGQSWDLGETGAVTLREADSTALKLAVGSVSYVQDQEQKVVPDEVTLTSYPNPLRRQATIEYTLTEPTDVRVTVYDVLGRRVAVLADERKEAGRHQVQLDGGRLASGVYFGRLKTEDRTLTQKITVVR